MTDDVLTSLRGAVTALPDDVALRLHLAELLLADGAPSEAIQHAAVVLEHDPENPSALALMAHALRAVPQPAEPPPAEPPPTAVPEEPAMDEPLATEDELPVEEPLLAEAARPAPEPQDDLRDHVDFDWRAGDVQATRELIARIWIGLIVAHVAILGGLIYARVTGGNVPLRIGAIVVIAAAIGLGAWRLTREHASLDREALTDAVRSDPPIMSGVVTASIGAFLLVVSMCTGGLVETDAELAGAATLILGLLLLITLASASRQPA